MVTFAKIFLTVLSLAVAVIAAPQGPEYAALGKRQKSTDPYWAKYWANDKANLTWDPRATTNGEFRVSWNEPNGGNFVVGKGFQTGKSIGFKYSGTFSPGANSNTYLALYGWTYNPTSEYYIMESFGVHHPADNPNSTCYGHFQSDGGTYEIWDKYNGQLHQLWAIRTKKRVGGTLTTGNFFKAFKAAGLKLGTQGEMIIGIEGQAGSGSATITAGTNPSTTVKETATPTTRTQVPVRTNTCTVSLQI